MSLQDELLYAWASGADGASCKNTTIPQKSVPICTYLQTQHHPVRCAHIRGPGFCLSTPPSLGPPVGGVPREKAKGELPN